MIRTPRNDIDWQAITAAYMAGTSLTNLWVQHCRKAEKPLAYYSFTRHRLIAERANLTRTEGAVQRSLCVQSFEGPHLVLDAPGAALQIRRGELCVRRGDGAERLFPPRKHGLRHIVLAASASLTTDALRWLVAEDVMLTISGQPGEAIGMFAHSRGTERSST